MPYQQQPARIHLCPAYHGRSGHPRTLLLARPEVWLGESDVPDKPGPQLSCASIHLCATSAPLVNNTENDDSNGIYAAENASGCLDPNVGAQVKTIIQGVENGTAT